MHSVEYDHLLHETYDWTWGMSLNGGLGNSSVVWSW